jgi:hypothetical protein
LTGERISANWTEVAKGGGLVGPVPCGYRRTKSGKVVIDKEPAPVVLRLFQEFATGKHSYRTLALWANEKGLRPPQQDRGNVGRKAGQLEFWTADRVGDILENIRYTGRSSSRSARTPMA